MELAAKIVMLTDITANLSLIFSDTAYRAIPITPNDRHVSGVLLMRISILLGAGLAGEVRSRRTCIYFAIIGCELMLLLECNILISQEHNTSQP